MAWIGASLPPKVHSIILITLAAVFAISEFHSRGLLADLSAILRRSGYSRWQFEELNQIVPELRGRVFRMWALSICIKAAMVTCAAILQWGELPPKATFWILLSGYAFLWFSIALVWWSWRNYKKVEEQLDKLAGIEIEKKEAKRLQREAASGEPHDFEHDEIAKGYTRPATSLP